MTNNTIKGVKKSNFTASTTIPDDATLDYVTNGQNVKIKQSDYLAGLGVSGSVEQDGDPLGTPVLDKQGTVNAIRNLVGGKGITTSIDAQNSIEIGTDFSFDQSGVAIVDDPLADAPAFKSLVAGTDISIVGAAGIATISANTDGLKPANRVIVNQASDFPAAVSGVIPLAANTEYYIGGAISVSDRFSLSAGNIVINGQAPVSSLTYTGTGDMFTGVDVGQATIRGLTVSQPSAASGDAIYNFSDSGSPTSVVNLDNTRVASCDTLAKYQNLFAITFNFFGVFSANQGIVTQGTGTGVLSIGEVALITTNAALVAVDLGTNVFNALDIMNLQVVGVAGTVGIKGLANSGNVLSGQVAAVQVSEFIGGVTPLDTISNNDFRFNFLGNSGIPDTNPDGLSSLTANATNTVIAAVDTPTLIAGTWVVEGASHFTGTTAGRLTYIGERDLTVPIDLVVDMEPASGTNKDLRVCIAINGATVPATCRLSRVDSGNPQSLSSVWQYTFTNGDYIEGFVENTSDAVDILVSGAVLRIR